MALMLHPINSIITIRNKADIACYATEHSRTRLTSITAMIVVMHAGYCAMAAIVPLGIMNTTMKSDCFMRGITKKWKNI